MTYKELLKDAWETIKEITSTQPLLRSEAMTWKEVLRLLKRSVMIGVWRCVVGFTIFVVAFLAVVTFLRAWAVVIHLAK